MFSSDTCLRWHNLSICSKDLDPSVETRLVVTLHNVSSDSFVCAHSTVIGTLKKAILKLFHVYVALRMMRTVLGALQQEGHDSSPAAEQ